MRGSVCGCMELCRVRRMEAQCHLRSDVLRVSLLVVSRLVGAALCGWSAFGSFRTLAQHLRGWDERRQAITQAAGRVHP